MESSFLLMERNAFEVEIKDFIKMKKLKNVHPGDILKEDFLDGMGITPYALAKAIQVDQTRINQLIKGTRNMSADEALRLGKFFNVSPEFWSNIQTRFDSEEVSQSCGVSGTRL